ncbi:sodium-dependent glucose transporter 1A-like [Mizuhopecten yessoensis]|uniref:sodium-dependent glucose transporter 1A-like n=1 Tax=Mizuhopecten yessoensis TaxID=6573 RepID=UPI000B458CA6|nr:sodium-dependent glucose transporter 1A-like [Mizuhopecten yessoensis]
MAEYPLDDKIDSAPDGNMNENTKTIHRQKLVYSVCLCASYLTCGWNLAQIGSALLDLKQITSVSLEAASLYQTFFNVGYFAGSLLCGIMYKRINKFLFQFISLLVVAIALVIIPWCHVHAAMVTAHFFVGLSGGIIDSVVNAEMLAVWGEKGLSYVQAMHFGYAFGGIISPVITAQFLAPTLDHHRDVIFSTTNYNASYINITNILGNHNLIGNLTSQSALYVNNTVYSTNQSIFREISTSLNSTRNSPTVFAPFYITSQVYIAYSISACLCTLIGLPYLVMYFTFDLTKIRSGRVPKEENSTPNITRIPKILVLINFGLMAGIYVAIEESFSGFLNAFCVNRLDWSSVDGSYATSVFYGCFGFGRLVAVLWVKYLNPKKFLSVFCVLLLLMFASILICGVYYFDIGMWLTAAATGLSIAVIYPTVFTWTEEDFLPVSGKISSFFNITSALGGTINPIVIGTLMDVYSPLWYAYLLMGESALLLMTCMCGMALSRKLRPQKRQGRQFEPADQENRFI